jgi:branched-chain amino acid aminotransferase
MPTNLKITTTNNSSLSKIDFDNIKFGQYFSDHMFLVDYIDGEWVDPRIEPLAPMAIHPGNMTLHYGQAVFEGMKATKDKDGNPLLFRPEMHSHRINNSAKRLCMPELPKELFLEAVKTIVNLDSDWIPQKKGSALYIRPFMFAMDNHVGVRASNKYRFMIVTLPVGPYYPRPVSLLAEEKYIRAALGGVGEAKAAGNYAAALYPTKLANEKGYDQVLWLDANEYKYCQEVGTMNIFFVIDGKVITPSTDGTILKGITRDSFLKILATNGITVEERPITIDEVVEAAKAGTLEECFGAGTAAVVAKVDRIGYRGTDYTVPDHYTIANLLKDTIDGLRFGTTEDVWGWTEKVSISEPIA